MRLIELTFNEVEVGKTVEKIIQVVNDSPIEQTYEVQRDPGTNPLDHVFDLRKYAWSLKPREVSSIEVYYRPFIAFSKNVDYFIVLDINDAVLQIIARGSSIGPKVVATKATLIFCSDTKKSVIRKRIRLTNESKATATFLLDIDPHYSIFRIKPRYGTIGPRSTETITITFTPPDIGKYTFFLPCLVLHQEPIMITLHGYCGDFVFNNESLLQCKCPWQIKDGFSGYMNDNVYTTGPLPPVSLSKNYFIFPYADGSEDKSVQRIPQVISMTNLADDNLLIEWGKDAEGVFEITPFKAVLRASDSILFEIRFYPNSRHPFFFREMTATVFVESDRDKYFLFPYVTTIRAIGNCVSPASVSWIPEYEIPHSVVMPPCIPLRLVHTTFLMRKSGKLPVMFRFVPPEVTRFTVKPMIGVIHSDYQIIAAEMSPKPEDGEIYVERWAVQLNGNEKDEVFVDFKGYAECANVCFSNGNVVNFPPTFPGTEHTQRVAMRNVTRHTIKYEFSAVPPNLQLQISSGEIHSNDILRHMWSFSPIDDEEYNFQVYCNLSVVANGTLIGSKHSVTLNVSGKGEKSYLMVVPNELNFHEQEYNSQSTLMFHVFNLSSITIHFKIICAHRNYPVGGIEKDVEISPEIGTVVPGDHKQMSLTITPRTVGYYELTVKYLIRKNGKTEEVMEEQVPRSLCTVNCACILPNLQVKNLCCYGTSAFLSKYLLWRVMKVARLNKLLKKVSPGSKEELNITNIQLTLDKDFFSIKLILINHSNIPLAWSIRRIYNCGCKPVKKQQGLSLTRTVFKCVHEELCSITPDSGYLEGKKKKTLVIDVRATLLGKSMISWDIAMSHDRHITVNLFVECVLDSEELFQVPDGGTIDFGQSHIGHKDAMYQAFSIRNLSELCLPYSINMDPILQINRTRKCNIFSCTTPCGVVNPRNSAVIILKFQARSFDSYRFKLPLKVGSKEIKLDVEAEGTCGCPMPISYQFMPTDCIRIPESPVHFNTHFIDIKCLPIFNYASRMILVHNNLKMDTLSYEWKRRIVPDILDVDVQPQNGLIRAGASRSFCVRIYSKGQPAKIELDVTCVFLNVSDRREYQRSILKYNILKEELKDQFTITEKGIDVPEPWLTILDEPKPLSKNLSIRCVIHSPENEFSAMTLTDKLKCAPRNTIPIDSKSSCKDICKDKKEISVCAFILEGILWEILNSKWLEHIMHGTLAKGMNLHYTQFVMDFWERQKCIKRSYITPPKELVQTILEKMLFVVLHEEFCLETKHLIPCDNIKHINYLREMSKKPLRCLPRTYEYIMNEEDPEEHLATEDEFRILEVSRVEARRVSFAD